MKLSPWRKGVVEWREGETVFLSIAFSWDADDVYQRSAFYRSEGRRVKVGGPGVFRPASLRADLESLGAEVGGSAPEAVTFHNPDATFASRGCPVGCWFCIVPAMEGREFTLLPDFEPRPILCDNNLSALSVEYQEHIRRNRQGGSIQPDLQVAQ